MPGPAEKYPRLVPDTPDASRISNAQIAEYVKLEGVASPDRYSERNVRFVRSARHWKGADVWIWECNTDEESIYVVAFKRRRELAVCLTTAGDTSMTPEELLDGMSL